MLTLDIINNSRPRHFPGWSFQHNLLHSRLSYHGNVPGKKWTAFIAQKTLKLSGYDEIVLRSTALSLGFRVSVQSTSTRGQEQLRNKPAIREQLYLISNLIRGETINSNARMWLMKTVHGNSFCGLVVFGCSLWKLSCPLALFFVISTLPADKERVVIITFLSEWKGGLECLFVLFGVLQLSRVPGQQIYSLTAYLPADMWE